MHSGSADQLNRSAISLRRARGSARLRSDWQQGSAVKHFIHQAPSQPLGEQLNHIKRSQSLHLTSSSSVAPSSSPFQAAQGSDPPLQVRNLHAGSKALIITLHWPAQ